MKVKRYIGTTVEQALAQIKNEMGSNAIILNKRKIKTGRGIFKLFSKPVYEVVAALDQPDTVRHRPFQSYENNMESLEKKVEQIKSSLESIMDRMQSGEEISRLPQSLLPYYRIMEDKEVSPKIINMIVEKVRNGLNTGAIYENDYLLFKFKKAISACINNVRTIELATGRPSVAVLVGPTGVGKTTTLAKLAARYSLNMRKKVGVITCDTFRIAAVDQLRTYCEIMDVPFQVVYHPQDVPRIMDEYRDMDLVLVDTAGRNHREKMKLMEVHNTLKGLGPQQTFLVISATTNYRNCQDIMKNYGFMEDYRLIITKVDESVANGILLNLAMESGKPLSYITTGQNVPDDIEEVDGDKIASLLLSG